MLADEPQKNTGGGDQFNVYTYKSYYPEAIDALDSIYFAVRRLELQHAGLFAAAFDTAGANDEGAGRWTYRRNS